jgi:hypothetical protein
LTVYDESMRSKADGRPQRVILAWMLLEEDERRYAKGGSTRRLLLVDAGIRRKTGAGAAAEAAEAGEG